MLTRSSTWSSSARVTPRVMGEVKAQAVGGDQRTLLFDVRPEHLPQGPVQQVGTGVVAPDGFPASGVDLGGGALPRAQ